jgi:VWFA-related protein
VRKALLILSGGAENGSRHTESEIRSLANAANVQIYALSSFEPNSSQTRLLSELAEGTGGIHLAVDDLNELPLSAARLGVELRNTYLLGYRSANRERSELYRNVEVRLLQPRGLPILRARWRPGFYASVLR